MRAGERREIVIVVVDVGEMVRTVILTVVLKQSFGTAVDIMGIFYVIL